MLSIGTLKSFNSTDYRAEVQLAGSIAAYLDNIPVARNIASDQMTAGRHVIVAIPGDNPRDACVIAVWDAAAGGGGGGGGGVAKLDDIGDVNVPTPSDDEFLYWLASASKWQAKIPDKRFYVLDNTTCIWRAWTNHVSSTPRTATIQSVSGDVITLTGSHAYRFGEWGDAPERMNASSVLLKIANSSKSPAQYAWVKGQPAGYNGNQLQVTSASDISGWSNGDTITTAEDGASSSAVELDLSPLLPEGTIVIFTKAQPMDDNAGGRGVGLSKDGAAGTWCWAKNPAAGLGGSAFPNTSLQSNRHMNVRDSAGGTDTLQHLVSVTAYVK